MAKRQPKTLLAHALATTDALLLVGNDGEIYAWNEGGEETLLTGSQAVSNAGRLVAELRATTGATDGENRTLKGFTSAGDGGGGLFQWRTGTATDNGGTILNQNGFGNSALGYWERVFSGPMDARWFGWSVDASAADNTTAWTRLMAACSSTDNASVELPAGLFEVNALSFPSKVRITGRGGPRGLNTLVGTTRLRYAGPDGGTAFTFQNVVNTHVEDLVLDGGGNEGDGTDGKGAAVVLSIEYLTTDTVFERVTVCGAILDNDPTQQGGKLLDFPGTLEIDLIKFKHCQLEQDPEDNTAKAKYALYNFNSNAFQISFEHSRLSGARWLAYFSQGSCDFHQCQFFHWNASTGRGIWVGTGAQPFSLTRCYTEGTSGTFLEIFPSAGANFGTKIQLVNCQVNDVCDIKTACTQALSLVDVSMGGNLVVDPVDDTNGIQRVTTKGCTFNLGKGVTGTGALTHVERLTDIEGISAGVAAGVPITRLLGQREPYSSDTTALDADAFVSTGVFWVPTLTGNRVWVPPGSVPGSVVQSGTGPAVDHTGTQVSDHFQMIIEITTGGIRGTAVFKWSKDGGVTYTTGVTTAATVVLGTTGYTATFATGTYVLNETYRWSSEYVLDGQRMLVSRRAGTDAYTLKIGAIATLYAGQWALLEWDTNLGWVKIAPQLAPVSATIYQSASGDATYTGATSFADLGNLSRTITIQEQSKIAFAFDGTFQYAGAIGIQLGYFQLLLDGSPIAGTVRAPTLYDTTGTTSIAISGITSALAAGAHTIKVQWHPYDAGATIGCYAASSPGVFDASLSVEEKLAA